MPRLVVASLVHVPAVLVLVGLAMALYGISASAAPLAWAVLAAWLVVGFLGELLSLPGWMMDLSPFQHVPALPADPFASAPLLVMLLVAVTLVAAGQLALRRRDITS